jgi:hypothetical protein
LSALQFRLRLLASPRLLATLPPQLAGRRRM